MRISNLKKSYGNFELNWQQSDCFENKVYGIIWANGCGKTTLLKMIAGLIEPDYGEIDRGSLTSRDITMVFKKPYILHDTVYKNLVYPLTLRKITPDENQVDFYLQLAGLEKMRNQYAPSLSSGEQQKLSFIQAMMFSPKVILMDEVFSNMDIESVALFEEHLLQSQNNSPVTWIIVSHQLSNVRRLCDYVYFMHKGEVKAEGTVAEVLADTQNLDLRKYLHYHII
jgi:ABC-type multidrug transport system ATPase subunit